MERDSIGLSYVVQSACSSVHAWIKRMLSPNNVIQLDRRRV